MEQNNEMYAELLKVAEQQLPKATADLLRQRLDLVDSLESKNKSLKAACDRFEEENKELRKNAKEQSELYSLKMELDCRGVELSIREDNLWKKEMEMKLQCANDKVELVTEFTRGLIRNTDFRSHVFGNTTKYENHQSTSNSYSHTEERRVE